MLVLYFTKNTNCMPCVKYLQYYLSQRIFWIGMNRKKMVWCYKKWQTRQVYKWPPLTLTSCLEMELLKQATEGCSLRMKRKLVCLHVFSSNFGCRLKILGALENDKMVHNQNVFWEISKKPLTVKYTGVFKLDNFCMGKCVWSRQHQMQ